jgi:hypothetical protein
MGRRIRCWESNVVYEGTQGCIDRQFLFVPNHRSDHPGFSLNPDQLDNASKFFQQLNSLIARQMNALYGREGHFFSSPLRATPCIDDLAAEQKLFYALTNPVKDNLVEKVSESPFFSTYDYLATGKPLRFWYIDWGAYYDAGGKACKKHRVKDYLHWVEIEPLPLPGWMTLTEHQRYTRVRQQTRTIEHQCRDKRDAEEKSVRGRRRLWEMAPTDRPTTLRNSGSQPICHASVFKTRNAFKLSWQEFLKAYREASIHYRQGHYEQPFPKGSFRPPLVTIYVASAL